MMNWEFTGGPNRILSSAYTRGHRGDLQMSIGGKDCSLQEGHNVGQQSISHSELGLPRAIVPEYLTKAGSAGWLGGNHFILCFAMWCRTGVLSTIPPITLFFLDLFTAFLRYIILHVDSFCSRALFGVHVRDWYVSVGRGKKQWLTVFLVLIGMFRWQRPWLWLNVIH